MSANNVYVNPQDLQDFEDLRFQQAAKQQQVEPGLLTRAKEIYGYIQELEKQQIVLDCIVFGEGKKKDGAKTVARDVPESLEGLLVVICRLAAVLVSVGSANNQRLR